MIDKYYRCDLCNASCPKETLNSFLIGIHWTHFPVHGWVKKDALTAEHHICQTCLDSLKLIEVHHPDPTVSGERADA